MSSNQKMQEYKLALKVNFAWKDTCLELFWDVLVIYQQCHRALLDMIYGVLETDNARKVVV